MDILEKKEYYINLFDFYEELLSTKQRTYFKEYYFDDLSLSEIADNYSVTRNAIYDGVTKVLKDLDKYEDKLELYKTYQKRNKIYDELLNSKDDYVLELAKKLKELE
jgi:predicted DNA-binding protein YlxM (UPF0122 family)